MRKLWPKYENWSKLGTEHHMYRYTPNMYRYMLAQNDQNLTCTDTCSRCTGTCHRKMPRMCVFLPFFHIFPPNSTLYFIHTSKPFHIPLITSIILKSSFNTPLMNSIELKHAFYSSLIQSLGLNSTLLSRNFG